MRVREEDELPQRVEVRRHVWVTVRDGCRLSARIWLPETADRTPVPALIEAIPYRKNDAYAQTDERRHRYLAAHGYATMRLDLRGSGDSDGVMLDEYLPTEQYDIVDAIAWLASQPWCDGSVGMTGLSWGGFNALQVAALRPPALKAILAVAASDDRYTDDVHYSGGCVLASEMLPWASKMLALNARPPDPEVVGEAWREQWLERMEHTPPYIERWLSHQHYDQYWRQGSVREDYDAIDCPVFIVSGWSDAYRDAVFRLLEHLPVTCKGLVGPWAHAYPELGSPGPAVGFLQESLRWWDHWLKGRDTGVLDDPPLRVWMQEWVAPEESSGPRPGRWVGEPCWPPTDAKEERWHLDPQHGLTQTLPKESSAVVQGDERVGVDAGLWLTKGDAGTLAADQRAEDEQSLTFTSEPLDAPLEILGHPRAQLLLESDRPVAQIAVRLCDVAPDGTSLLVTRALRNLTHRDGHDDPRPLAPGETFAAEVPLTSIAYVFPAGHRIRLSLSPTYWPWAWPSPEPVRLTVHTGLDSLLSLPLRAPRDEDDGLSSFEPAETAPPPATEFSCRPVPVRSVSDDPATGRREIVWRTEPGRDELLLEDGLRYGEMRDDRFSVVPGDPLSAEVHSRWTIWVERGDWRTRMETESVMSGGPTVFRVDNVLDAYEDDEKVFTKSWSFRTNRDGV